MSKPLVYIVGLGIFGSFIAQKLIKEGYAVKGFDNDNVNAASRGVNVRTIRGDYTDPEEMRIAYECLRRWERKHSQSFTNRGRLVVYQPGDSTIENINKARKKLLLGERIINSSQTLNKLRLDFDLNIDTDTDQKAVFNEDDGLIDLSEILQTLKTSIPHEKVNIKSLTFNSGLNKITGLSTDSGECIDTSEAFVFITAGAWTPKLLLDAGIPYQREVSRAVGLFSFPIYLSREHASNLSKKPAISIIGVGKITTLILIKKTDIQTDILLGQFTAPIRDNDLTGWITWVKRLFSVDDLFDPVDYSISPYATKAKLEVFKWLQLSHEFKNVRIGPPQFNFDSVTSDQRHQIFRIEKSNAIVATNGSWHGAKKAISVAEHALQVFKGNPSIYDSSEMTQHPHQPQLNTYEKFSDLNAAAEKEDEVMKFNLYSQFSWIVTENWQQFEEDLAKQQSLINNHLEKAT
ncbi:MAG: hypothetical protein M1829_002923 [Trizodia sp. TS-e1964]|nr:MAG: hypothetical protein M1829_002923 [Trizodia sp. TS-e1964]